MKQIVTGLLLSVSFSFGVLAADEIPTDSYPLMRFARCEETPGFAGQLRSFLSNDPWSFSLYLGRADLDGEALSLLLFSREYGCRKPTDDVNSYHWLPLTQHDDNSAYVQCNDGKLRERNRMKRYWRQMNASISYVDRWSSVNVSVPLKECMKKAEYKRFQNGEAVDVRLKTAYRPTAPNFNEANWMNNWYTQNIWSYEIVVHIPASGSGQTLTITQRQIR